MINYYDILGVSRNALLPEIKAAFRRLAKQYHPDKNPDGKEYFEKVLQAYEVLSQPERKRAYDYKLNYHKGETPAVRRKSGTTKNWKFDEKELKRRQYYNEHIKKHAKTTAAYNQQAENRKTYNEFKYILYATPLAVALFLLIMKLAQPGRDSLTGTEVNKHEATFGLQPGESPYNHIFGQPVYDTSGKGTFVVKNRSAADAVICAFTAKRFIRCFFVPANFSVSVPQLPPEPLFFRYSAGQNFSLPDEKKNGRPGGFRHQPRFYKSTEAVNVGKYNEIVILPGDNSGFELTDEQGFFKQP